jgi:aryl-alcohol dehydrogenase-like predicted oxidoreductase
MEYRPLGRTGVSVSKLCLGTMMFGAWGNTDHDDSIRIIHAALDAGISFVDSADISLIELAIAFVVNHPAVTSAIIGPRTMEQLDRQLPATDVTLDHAVLDRIDQIVRPGVNLNPADTSYGEQTLKAALRRR